MLARIYPKQVSIEIEQENIPADFYSAFETLVIGTIRVHPGARLLTPVGLGKVGSGSSILVREVDKEDFRGRRFSVHLGETDEIIAQIDGYARPGGGVIFIEWEREAESFVNDLYLVLHESADVPLPEWVSLVRPDVQQAPVSRTTLIKSFNVFVQNSTNVFFPDQDSGKPPNEVIRADRIVPSKELVREMLGNKPRSGHREKLWKTYQENEWAREVSMETMAEWIGISPQQAYAQKAQYLGKSEKNQKKPE